MSHQQITPELRDWIVAQARNGVPAEDVLKSMLQSGWEESVALQALETTIERFLTDHAKENGLPQPVPVPEPDLGGAPSVIVTPDGREVRLLMSMRNPRVVVFGGLLSDEECDEIRQLASPRIARSETVDNQTGGSELNDARTSDGMFFERGEHPVIQRVEARLAALANWPVENGEGLQVLRYGVGAEYKPHYDYFDPAQKGTPTILKRGGQRVATFVMYLNTVARGGGTSFPDVNVEVAPIKGNAVFFSYDRPHPMTRSLHGGTPVQEGEKWVATKWLRERRFA